MTYRRRASPLHATRALVGALYCMALAAAALLSDDPIVLGAVAVSVLGAAWGAGVAGPVARAMRFSLVLALLIALINPLLDRNGLTVVARFGEVPPLGQLDVTLEAFVYGLVLGLRVLVIIAAAALFTAAVDPDALLRLFRRVSFRSALTAVLATRLVPVLAADGRRLAEAQRCRADGGGSRTALVRAVATGALDRAVDVAATLEVRGFGIARRAPAGGDPWSRHDVAFLASALVVLAVVIGGRVAGVAGAGYYPELHVDTGAATLAAAAVLVAVALAPFADRRGVGA